MEDSITRKADLFLLTPDFEDGAFPGQRFFCRHCALVEGVLASFPALTDHVRVHRIGFTRPRAEVVALIGEANQSLPVLILPPGPGSTHGMGDSQRRQFASGAEPILAIFTEIYGIPPAHP